MREAGSYLVASFAVEPAALRPSRRVPKRRSTPIWGSRWDPLASGDDIVDELVVADVVEPGNVEPGLSP